MEQVERIGEAKQRTGYGSRFETSIVGGGQGREEMVSKIHLFHLQTGDHSAARHQEQGYSVRIQIVHQGCCAAALQDPAHREIRV